MTADLPLRRNCMPKLYKVEIMNTKTAVLSTRWAKIPVDTVKLIQITAVSLICWYFFKPAALSNDAWKLFVIFVSTVVAIIAKPLPMGAIALTSVGLLTLTKTLTLQTALQGFAYDQIWLIVLACFLARGFIKTGLGRRIAYGFLSLFGGTPLGMGYGLIISSCCMSPLIPSTTARTAGIVLPVLRSIITVIQGNQATAAFLTLVVMHASVITSAMFVTANAGNPIILKFAQNMGIEISWITWAEAAILPGIVSLLLLPFMLKFFIPCTVADAQAVKTHAHEELATMGKIRWQEKALLGVFALLLALWSFGSFFGVHATEAALYGVGLLLLLKVLSWKDILDEELAWDTFMWMGILIMMASEMQKLGVISWFTDSVVTFLPAACWQWQLLLLALVYFYSHYLFASTVAHVSSMYGPFLALAVSTGAPPVAAMLLLGFLSSLFGAITHYASGPAPILYSQQHIDVKTWWKVGFITSIAYLVIWGGLGTLWWSFLGLI